MIHSLAGGDIRELKVADFAKVEIIEKGPLCGAKYWYIFDLLGLEIGDRVFVPVGVKNVKMLAKIERIDRFVNEQCAPVPFKRAKRIIEKA